MDQCLDDTVITSNGKACAKQCDLGQTRKLLVKLNFKNLEYIDGGKNSDMKLIDQY